MDWRGEKPKLLKYKNGEGRRKRLFIDAMKLRAIKPNITFLEMLYNLVLRRQRYYDNSDKMLTDRILIEDAEIVLNMKLEDIYALKSSRHGGFITDPVYCAEHGISRKQHARTVRKKLHYKSIGEWYDLSVSVNENCNWAKENGIKISLNTLKNFCWDNDIDLYPNRKPITEWYDETLSVKQNLEWAHEHGIKVSQSQLYNYCREHHINTKGESDTD